MSTEAEYIERPATLNERRIQGENIYNSFYYWFKTHSPADWCEPDWGKEYMFSFPPYCYRFDEFLGFTLTIGIGISNFLNKMFPNPDFMDLEHLEDTLFTLDCIVHEEKGYQCTKGLGAHIGPASHPRYQASLAEARLWLETAKEEVKKKNILEKVTGKVQTNSNQAISGKAGALPAKFFLNGFDIEKLTKMLIALDILTESINHTASSKPRNWRAVIEALRDNKLLVYNANTILFELLKVQYAYPYGIRSIQSPFSTKNLDTQDIYKRANEWCAINR
jgi:hypothetical protein